MSDRYTILVTNQYCEIWRELNNGLQNDLKTELPFFAGIISWEQTKAKMLKDLTVLIAFDMKRTS
jgi:hypothetical protein